MPRAPCTAATTEAQNESLAELRREVKWAIYEGAGDDRTIYHRVSCKPITLTAEDDMELLSDVFSQGETFLHYWEEGHYGCSRCGNKVFSSEDKWKGPCVWPSFRKPYDANSLDLAEVSPYNGYACKVQEAYCKQCDLFLGHGFEDGKQKGDVHEDAHWRF